MTEVGSKLNDLVAVLKDGVAFYEEVVKADPNPDLTPLFRDMVSMREEAILQLVPVIVSEDETVRQRGTFAGEIHKGFAKVRAILQDSESAYLSELVALENRTVEGLQACLENTTSAELAVLLDDLCKRFRRNAEVLHAANVSS